MAQTASEIVKEIQSHRSRLGKDLNDLQAKVKESTDWHTHYRERPHWFLGAAFVGGVVAAALIAGPRKLKSRTVAPPVEPEFRYAASHPSAPPVRSEVQRVVDEVKGALIAFGIAKVKDAITAAVPGLGPHLGSPRRS